MSLISEQYFINEINIPDRGDYDNVSDFIDRYEKDFLIKMFGYTLYKLISDYDEEESEQRIKDIVEGKEFEVGDFTYKWEGLINDTDFVSPIAYYVYFYYMKSQLTSVSSVGELKDKFENAEPNTGTKIVTAWQNLTRLIGESDNAYYYNSLLYFMRANYETYPEWQYDNMSFVPINSFDI